MALGPGKYDDVCTELRQKTAAEGVIVIVLNGTKGSGFSAQLPLLTQFEIARLLRSVADQIDDSGPFA
jgi:hypothetical protein